MRIKNKLLGLIFTIAITGQLFAQTGVIISTEANQVPHESAMLEIKSNGKGFLIPRMTMLERANIQIPAEGLLVYQTNDVKGFYYYTGTEWTAFVSISDITNWDTDVSNDITTSQITNIGSGQVITQTERNKLNTITEKADRTPIGTISAFGGITPPEGWLLCNGSSKFINEFPDLFTAISNNWGGDGNTTFNLPDLRGQFLRGTDNGTGNDPDAANRTKIDGTTVIGDLVGSYQKDELNSHNHSMKGDYGVGNNGFFTFSNENRSGSQNTENSGGSETRPKNASVNYIIKY